MKKQIIIAALLVLLSTQTAFAQKDSQYIKKFDTDFAVQTYLSNKFTWIGYEPAEGKSGTYMSNTPIGLGLGIAWKSILLAASYGVVYLNSELHGNTSAVDLQLNYYGRNILINAAAQTYKGFYLSERNPFGNLEEVLHPEISILRFSFYGEYVFNGNKFSYAAAISQREKQIKSAGSFLLGGGLYYNRIFTDDSLDENALSTIESYQIGPTLGYGYTFVITKDFSITGSLAAGVSFAVSHDNKGNSNEAVFPVIIPRIAAGYDTQKWGVGISYTLNHGDAADINDAKISITTGRFILRYIYRFDLHIPFFEDLEKKYYGN